MHLAACCVDNRGCKRNLHWLLSWSCLEAVASRKLMCWPPEAMLCWCASGAVMLASLLAVSNKLFLIVVAADLGKCVAATLTQDLSSCSWVHHVTGIPCNACSPCAMWWLSASSTSLESAQQLQSC